MAITVRLSCHADQNSLVVVCRPVYGFCYSNAAQLGSADVFVFTGEWLAFWPTGAAHAAGLGHKLSWGCGSGH